MVARSWQRNCLEGILCIQADGLTNILPSPFISLPLRSIMRIARESGLRGTITSPSCIDPCVVCLERGCTVSAEGCNHEFCTKCALYLCSTNCTSTSLPGPPGSIPCPLCRHSIVSFCKIPAMSSARELPRTSLSSSLCTCPTVDASDSSDSMDIELGKPDSPMGSSSFRSLSCQRCPSFKLNSTFCMGVPDASPCLLRCSRSGSSLSRSASQRERSSRSCLQPYCH